MNRLDFFKRCGKYVAGLVAVVNSLPADSADVVAVKEIEPVYVEYTAFVSGGESGQILKLCDTNPMHLEWVDPQSIEG